MAGSQVSDTGSHVHLHTKGLSVPFAAFFIVGEIAGSGVLALPKAIDDSGWIGLPLLVVYTLISSYTGSILGESWLIVQERHPEYRSHCPDPYPTLAEKTFGKKGRYLVSFSINFTLFGGSTVFLLLASQNTQHLIEGWFDVNESFCIWLVILAAIICPLTWFGTPVDFWPVAVGATCTTGVACIILIVKVAMDAGTYSTVLHSHTEFQPFSMAFGTLMFAIGGHPAFPTIQADMKNPGNFKWAVLLGFTVVILMYLPLTSLAYFVYGKNVQPNILQMSNGVINQVVEVMITIHLLLALLIVINPVCQELESLARVPKHFSWKRCVFRSMVVASILFVAETIPKFNDILSLVGGSTVTLLAYICPPLFYLKLKSVSSHETVRMNDGDVEIVSLPSETLGLPLWVKVMNIEIILLGAVPGIISTYSALKSIIGSDFSKPCYV